MEGWIQSPLERPPAFRARPQNPQTLENVLAFASGVDVELSIRDPVFVYGLCGISISDQGETIRIMDEQTHL